MYHSFQHWVSFFYCNPTSYIRASNESRLNSDSFHCSKQAPWCPYPWLYRVLWAQVMIAHWWHLSEKYPYQQMEPADKYDTSLQHWQWRWQSHWHVWEDMCTWSLDKMLVKQQSWPLVSKLDHIWQHSPLLLPTTTFKCEMGDADSYCSVSQIIPLHLHKKWFTQTLAGTWGSLLLQCGPGYLFFDNK